MYVLYFDKNLESEANHYYATGYAYKFAERNCDASFAICIQRCKSSPILFSSLHSHLHLSGVSRVEDVKDSSKNHAADFSTSPCIDVVLRSFFPSHDVRLINQRNLYECHEW